MISTTTITIFTNLTVDIFLLFDILTLDENVIFCKCGDRIKSSINFDKCYFFKNSITIIFLNEKLINFKLSKNGTIQVTGSRNIEQVKLCLFLFWSKIKKFTSCYNIVSGKFHLDSQDFEVLIIPCMQNLNFSLNFPLEKNKFIQFIQTCEELKDFHCIFSTFSSYSGINVKHIIPEEKLHQHKLLKIKFRSNYMIHDTIEYKEYLNYLTPKEQLNKRRKPKKDSFLFFQTGKCIYSGVCLELMEETYNFLTSILDKNKDKFIEQIE